MSNHLVIKSLEEAESFVSRQKDMGNNVFWENYDMVFFRPAEQGIYSKQGAFRDGQWGFDNRTQVEEDGTWRVDWRNVRRNKHTRN